MTGAADLIRRLSRRRRRETPDEAEARRQAQAAQDRRREQQREGGPDPYRVLDVPRGATPEEITARYRSLALKYHPDRNSSPDASERFQEIERAYRKISA